MVRTLLLLLVAFTAVGVVATPGLAGAALLIVPLAVVGVVWWIALGAATPGRRTDPFIRVRHREFLGPGGPDDPFASAAPGRPHGTELEPDHREPRQPTSGAPHG
jgi:hypothetical protein